MAGDYDYEPEQKKGQFIRLRQKGEAVTVRIASRPYRFPTIWKLGVNKPMDSDSVLLMQPSDWFNVKKDPDYTINETYCWVVIDREDNAARLLQATAGVYKSIQEFAKDPAWGDPQTYDIRITRTETPGSGYYKVVALPNRDALTITQTEAVQNLNVPVLLPTARTTTSKQVDDITDYLAGMEAAQSHTDEAPIQPSRVVEPDPVIEDLGDEPINLDDIPFEDDSDDVGKSSGKVL